MTASQKKKGGRAALVVVLCLLAVCLAAGGTAYALLNRKVSALQSGAAFQFDYTVTSTAASTPALYGVLAQVGATEGTLSGQYAPGKLQLSFARSGSSKPFTRVYIDRNETLYDAGQLYEYIRGIAADNVPLAGLLLPSWGMGSYISQTQLASVLGVELSAVEMQDMTSLTLTLGALQKVTPDGALDGYTYFQLPAEGTDLTCIIGLPLRELFAGTTPLHILLTVPEHSVTLSLSGTVTAADTSALSAPASRMSDEDVDTFVQLRQTLESFGQLLSSALQNAQ